jgi:hypothetical protein
MAKEGKGYNQSMFTNKDGYLTGGKKIKIASQNIHLDPRSKSSIRGRNYIAQGDTNTARGSGAAKKQKVTWF